MNEFRTGAVFELADQFSRNFEKLDANLTESEKKVRKLQLAIDKLGFGPVITKMRGELFEMDALVARNITGIARKFGSLPEAIAPAWAAVTKEAGSAFKEVTKSAALMGADVIDRFRATGFASMTAMRETIATSSAGMFAPIDAEMAGVTGRIAALKTGVAGIGAGIKVPSNASAAAAVGSSLPDAHLGNRRGGSHGGDSLHFGRVGAEVPGGHVSMKGNIALAGLGVVAASIYEAAELDDVVTKAAITGQLPMNGDFLKSPAAQKLRDTIQKTSALSGYSLKDTGEAFLGIERMLGGVDFDTRLSVMNTIAPYAAIEAKMKEGTSLKESFESFVGMAHMTGEYNPEKLKQLAQRFAFTSINTTASLPQFEKTLSYSLPMLHNALGMDADSVMLMTAMAQNAGINSTKSGTWIRSFFENSEPSIGDTDTAKKHNEALRKLGLLDAQDRVTWRKTGANGQIDWTGSILNMAGILGHKLHELPIDQRLGILKQAWGERGGGFGALMGLDTFAEQMPIMAGKMRGFTGADKALQEYAENSPIQKANLALRDFENILADLGGKVLPPVNAALGALDSALKLIPDYVKGNKPFAESDMGKRILENMRASDDYWFGNHAMVDGLVNPFKTTSDAHQEFQRQRQQFFGGTVQKNAFITGFDDVAGISSGPLADATYSGFMRAFKELQAGGAAAASGGGIINAAYTTFGGGGGGRGMGGGGFNPYAGGAAGGSFVPMVGDHLTAGMRANNLGNLGFFGQHMAGLIGPSNSRDIDHSIALFATQDDGIRAAGALAWSKYARGRHDAWSIIAAAGGWTPGALGPGAAANISRMMGLGIHDDLHLDQPGHMVKFLHALGIQEHGAAGRYYTEDRIRGALGRAAGPPPRTVSPGKPSSAPRIEAMYLPPIHVHTTHMLDGKVLAKTITKHQAVASANPGSVGGTDSYGHWQHPGADGVDPA